MHACAYDRGEGETGVFAEIFSRDIIGEYQWQTQPYSVAFGIRTQATLASALATEAQKRGGDGRGEGKEEGEGESTLTVKFLAKAKKPTPAVRVASAFLERRSLTIPSEPENAA